MKLIDRNKEDVISRAAWILVAEIGEDRTTINAYAKTANSIQHLLVPLLQMTIIEVSKP
tara:strand:+ start:566 stop:742 length:177 start_codon:yes stop_codon:yes gene_type:complete